MLAEVKTALGVTISELDTEIQNLINAAQADLILAGVTPEKAQNTGDPLIKQAILTYCKAHFRFDNPDAPLLSESYDLQKARLSAAVDYNSYAVTFVVTAGGLTVAGAGITANGTKKLTNSQGMAVFAITDSGIDVNYVISKSGYQVVEGSVYVDGSKTVEVALNAI